MTQRVVSREFLLDSIAEAVNNEEQFSALRTFIFNYYSADVDYLFESKDLQAILALLASYFEFEEAFGDPDRSKRLRRLQSAIQQDSSPESALVALQYDQVSALMEKLKTAVISEFTFQSQLRKLSPVKVHWKKVLEFYESHPDLAYA